MVAQQRQPQHQQHQRDRERGRKPARLPDARKREIARQVQSETYTREDVVYLPQNLEAENALVHAVMGYQELLDTVKFMRPEMFMQQHNKVLWECYTDLRQHGLDIDPITVNGWLTNHEKMADMPDGKLHAYSLGNLPYPDTHARTWAYQVMETWVWREQLTQNSQLVNWAYQRMPLEEFAASVKMVNDLMQEAVVDVGMAKGSLTGTDAPFNLKGVRQMRELPPPSYLVAGWIEDHSLGMLYGDTNVGKSFIALDLALSVAAGTSWQGHQTGDPSTVVYMAAEGVRGVSRRLDAWASYHHVSDDTLDRFVVMDQCPNLYDQSQVAMAIEQIKRLPEPPSLVIIDTLASAMFGGDENQTQDANDVVFVLRQMVRDLHCTVLVVHHTGKDASKGPRGNSAILAAMDFAHSMVAKPDGTIVLYPHKLRDQRKSGVGLLFRLQQQVASEDGRLTSAVPVLVDGQFDASEMQSQPQAHAREGRAEQQPKSVPALIEVMKRHPDIHRYNDIRKLFMAETNMSESSYERAMRIARETGQVVEDTRGNYLADHPDL